MQDQSLAPMGCLVRLHNKPDIRKTWDNNVIKGYYVETSREHYRCFKIWVKNNRSIQITDTMFFTHRYITMPEISKADAIMVAANHLAQVYKGKYQQTSGKSAHNSSHGW